MEEMVDSIKNSDQSLCLELNDKKHDWVLKTLANHELLEQLKAINPFKDGDKIEWMWVMTSEIVIICIQYTLLLSLFP